MTTILIGLDDTDNETSPGTGRLARVLADECLQRGLAPLGVTRHQFLVDPRIPYTSHNSGACVAVRSSDGVRPVLFAFDFIAERAAEGSDPGLCVASADTVSPEMVSFGRRAAVEILSTPGALAVARAAGVALRPLGGTGLGVIGALASVALRADGNDGRFIDLPGLRQLSGRVAAADLTRLGIHLEHRGRAAQPHDEYETLGWVRPSLLAGRPVLAVQWQEEQNAWVPVERKRSRPLE